MNNKNVIVNAIDQNGNGQIDIEDIVILGLRMPGVNVDRDSFLRKELYKYCPRNVVNKAVQTNPMSAGVSNEIIERISANVIEKERKEVTAVSTALGLPGGAAMAATIPADIVQYFGFMLKAVQELMYLYGFPEIDVEQNADQTFDSETMNILILSMGVMYGVAGANRGLKVVAQALGKGVEKKLLNAALTKGTIYPIVKSVSRWFGVHMTKQVFAGFFKKAIPVVGGAVGGGITYLTFKPCCVKLQKSLSDTYLSNPEYVVDDSLMIYDSDSIEVGHA